MDFNITYADPIQFLFLFKFAILGLSVVINAMTYDYKRKKIVALVSDELENWQAINTVGHLAIALGANKDNELMGRPILVDKTDVRHIGIARFGFIIKKTDKNSLAKIIRETRKSTTIQLIDFPREMLDTRHDDELAESLAHADEESLEYLGALLYGPTQEVDQLTKSSKLWG